MALQFQNIKPKSNQLGLFFLLIVVTVSCSTENTSKPQLDKNTIEIIGSIENLKSKIDETRILIDSSQNSNKRTNFKPIEKIQIDKDSQEIKIIMSSAETD